MTLAELALRRQERADADERAGIAALEQVVEVFAGEPDASRLLTARSDTRDKSWSGLTAGSLRALLAHVRELEEKRDELADRLSHIRGTVAEDATRCGGCRDSAFRHRLSCDVLRTADVDGSYDRKS